VLLFAAAILWLSRMVTSAPSEVELTAHHPFRSPAAKERYLARYEERARLWPVPSETRMVETSWGSTFVRVSGPPDAPPLVLLPGANATSLQWLPNIEALNRTRRTYAVDNVYDFGLSVYTRRFTSAADFVAWLDEILSALELGDDTALMGLSYGGWLTVQYALARPERLDRAVALAPAGTILPLSGGFIVRAVFAAIPHRFFVRNLLYWLAEDSVSAGPAMRREVDAFIDDGYIGLRTFAFKQLVNPTVLSDEELASISVPMLVLIGENEKIYAAEAAVERLRRVAPAIEAEIIPGAGHDLTLVQADLVDRRIVRFLDPPQP
jgi:pimeloyl-ACP methyl ester carboxylesterase